ncbi:uncharacterized protein TNCV_5079141 [Trichonephila clavipes]|nr:uncharacterized protein TNCV_5079141 [Trichonephila clavipes]
MQRFLRRGLCASDSSGHIGLTNTSSEPNFEKEIPSLYGKDFDKVQLHMDRASSHTSKSTATYLAKKESETGMKYIPFDEIHIKSPYASAMNFCAFGL